MSLPIPAESRLHAALAESKSDVLASQRLRHRVFVQELGARLAAAPDGHEQDRFDPHCLHLLVRDGPAGPVVASTRILTDEAAAAAGGFYSQGEFDLAAVRQLPGPLMEIGRTCVAAEHRSGAAIGVLWAGLAGLVRSREVRHLMGCASIPLDDGGLQAAAIMQRIRARHLSPPRLRVSPLRPLPVPAPSTTGLTPVMPPLLKAYLRLGAWVCGEPCWDPEFRVADVFVLLDVTRLDTRYARHFLRRPDLLAPDYAVAS